MAAGDPIDRSIVELLRWAGQLDFIATKVETSDRPDALALVGGQQPYVFVLDPARWPDGLHHLCDRGYQPIEGVALSRAELASIGIAEWEQRYGSHGGNSMFSVINDDVSGTRDASLLMRAARLLVAIALTIDTNVYGQTAPTREH